MRQIHERVPSASILVGVLAFFILLILKLTGATTIPWIAVFLIPMIPFTLVLLGLVAIPVIAVLGFTVAAICDIWIGRRRSKNETR